MIKKSEMGYLISQAQILKQVYNIELIKLFEMKNIYI